MSKELTLKSAVDLHREMWNWLVDNPGKWKDEWDRWEEIKDEYDKDKIEWLCFMCDYIKQNQLGCADCPLDWGNGFRCSFNNNGGSGLFKKWLGKMCIEEFEEATKLAKTIANLPLKPEYQQEYENECEPKFYASSDWVNGIMKGEKEE